MPGGSHARLPIPLRSALLIVLALALGFSAVREQVIARDARDRARFAKAFAVSFERMARTSEKRAREAHGNAVRPAPRPEWNLTGKNSTLADFGVMELIQIAYSESKASEYRSLARQHHAAAAQLHGRGRLAAPEAAGVLVILAIALFDTARRHHAASRESENTLISPHAH